MSIVPDIARSVILNGKPTGPDRFVENATLAIATFQHRRKTSTLFDRPLARKKLLSTVEIVWKAFHSLNEIATNRQLSYFLETIWADASDSKAETKERAPKATSTKALRSSLKRRLEWRELYREFEPYQLSALLMKLEPVLSLAAERVEFQSGDFQRDAIAQEFCDNLAFAWISGTGQIPKFSKPNRRSRNDRRVADHRVRWVARRCRVPFATAETIIANAGFSDAEPR